MTFDADNQLVKFNGIPTSFDADGNMTQGPLGGNPPAPLTYNSRNQLIAAGGLYYLYDAENTRTGVYDGTNVYGYIYDQSVPLSRLLAKVNSDGSATFYIYGLGLISDNEGGNYRVYHFDARGSTVAMTDGSGNVIGKAFYGPFGEILKRKGALASTPFLFNGRYGVGTDANGLYYMRSRYYDPTIHRFINQDPTLGSLIDGSGLNRFAFVNGNPISFIDPFGLSKDEDRNVGTFDFGSIPNPLGISSQPLDDGRVDDVLDPVTIALIASGGELFDFAGGLLKGIAPRTIGAISRLFGVETRVAGTGISEILAPGGNLIGDAGNGYRIRVIQGGAEDAETLFQQLTEGGELNTTTGYPGRLVNIPGGGTVGIRTISTKSPNTAATIDVNNVLGLEDLIKEIKFNP